MDELNVKLFNIDIIYIFFYWFLKLGSLIYIVVFKCKKFYLFFYKWYLIFWKSLGMIDYKYYEYVELYNIKFFILGGRKYYKRFVCDDFG